MECVLCGTKFEVDMIIQVKVLECGIAHSLCWDKEKHPWSYTDECFASDRWCGCDACCMVRAYKEFNSAGLTWEGTTALEHER